MSSTGKYASAQETYVGQDSITHYYKTNIETIETDSGSCVLAYFGLPYFWTNIPSDSGILDVLTYYHSIQGDTCFDIQVDKTLADAIRWELKWRKIENVDFANPPFLIQDDTIARLCLHEIQDSNEITWYHGGSYFRINCNLFFDNGDSAVYNFGGGLDWSNSEHLGVTLPIQCLLDKYSPLFYGDEFSSLFSDNELAQIIIRFIRWENLK